MKEVVSCFLREGLFVRAGRYREEDGSRPMGPPYGSTFFSTKGNDIQGSRSDQAHQRNALGKICVVIMTGTLTCRYAGR